MVAMVPYSNDKKSKSINNTYLVIAGVGTPLVRKVGFPRTTGTSAFSEPPFKYVNSWSWACLISSLQSYTEDRGQHNSAHVKNTKVFRTRIKQFLTEERASKQLNS